MGVKKQSINDILSRRISGMSFLMALLVVIDHSYCASEKVSIWMLINCISKGLCQIAVPYFFTISGFLLVGKYFNPIDKLEFTFKNYFHEVNKRIYSLLLPFFVWSIIGSFIYIIINRKFINIDNIEILKFFGVYPFDLPTLTPLWYIRSLFMLVVISPLLYLMVKRGGVFTLIFWFLVSIILSKILSRFIKLNMLLGTFLPLKWGCFYFSLGMYLRMYPININNYIKSLSIVSLFVGIILIILSKYMMLHKIPFAPLLLKITIPIVLFAVWELCPTPHYGLGMYSFPIYLIHYIILWVASSILPINGLIGYFYRILMAIFFSMLITKIIRYKRSQQIEKFLFGGR